MLLFVGTYTEPIRFGTGKVLQGKGEGIYAYRLDGSSGTLRLVGKTAGVANPSYLALDRSVTFLYAVNELKTFDGKPTGTVSSFAVDARTGALRFLNRQPTHGADPCHVVLDDAGEHAFVANFMSGSVCVLPIAADGTLGTACDFVQHVGSSIDPDRQSGPHAHSVTLDPSDRFAFVPDLGLDKLMLYRFDRERGMLEPNTMPWVKTKPGAGPRQLALHPDGRFAYLVNELASTIDVLAFEAGGAALRYVQSVTTLPDAFAGESTCADIHVHPTGRFVYASNRGHDSIAIHAVDRACGALARTGHVSTLGRTPRSFAIDPSGRFLVAANQDTDSLATFAIDSQTGMLQAIGEPVAAPTPVCVKFAVSSRRP